MENYTEIFKNVISMVQEMISKSINKAAYDKTFRAIVIDKKKDGVYEIEYKGKRYSARCKTPLEAGKIVTVCAPQNKWNELYIQSDEEYVLNELSSKFFADTLKGGTALDIIEQLRYGHGQCGSVYVDDCTYVNVSISEGWYNFLWIPHRNGGKERDNFNYGTLTLYPMNMTGNMYVIQYSQGKISMVKVL